MKYLSIVLFVVSLAFSNQKLKDETTYNTEQKEAFTILTNKCNVCHRTQNPKRVFTLENMDRFAQKINRQVFVWKQMPKGNEIKLTTQEKQTLKNWINLSK